MLSLFAGQLLYSRKLVAGRWLWHVSLNGVQLPVAGCSTREEAAVMVRQIAEMWNSAKK